MEDNIKKKFLNLNLEIIKYIDKKDETVVANRNIFDQMLRTIWSCSILNNYKHQNITLFTHRNFSFTNKIYKNFGIKNIKYISVKTIMLKKPLNSIVFFINSFFLYFYFSIKGIDYFIKNFKVKGIAPGTIIHESYIKKNKYYLDKSFFLPIFYFIKILSSHVLINYLENYIKNSHVKNIIINKKEYFALESLLFLIAKKNKLSLIILSQEKILQDKSITFNEKFYNFSDKEIKKKVSIKKINNYVKKRFAGKTDKDSGYAYKKKNKKDPFQLKKIFPVNKKKEYFILSTFIF